MPFVLRKPHSHFDEAPLCHFDMHNSATTPGLKDLYDMQLGQSAMYASSQPPWPTCMS